MCSPHKQCADSKAGRLLQRAHSMLLLWLYGESDPSLWASLSGCEDDTPERKRHAAGRTTARLPPPKHKHISSHTIGHPPATHPPVPVAGERKQPTTVT